MVVASGRGHAVSHEGHDVSATKDTKHTKENAEKLFVRFVSFVAKTSWHRGPALRRARTDA